MILTTLRYASYMQHTQDVERKKMRDSMRSKAPQRDQGSQTGDGRSDAGSGGLLVDGSPVNSGAEEALMGNGEGSVRGQGFVSLG